MFSFSKRLLATSDRSVLLSSTPVFSTNAVNNIERGVNVCIFIAI
ncbi:hypothetical protein BAZMOX_22098_1 [methanotrophic endosymbiont of Bathymodiolus azoricus (Menez Gwen)]|nr:hypothetical protein BAZMOX_22098_1 [methanotrophic endosymbiont of Bathymodiolus azoricus (Menez Gwen)]